MGALLWLGPTSGRYRRCPLSSLMKRGRFWQCRIPGNQCAAATRVERFGVLVTFAVREYVLVFRRTLDAGHSGARPVWRVVRPPMSPSPRSTARRAPGRRLPAQMLAVPVCSTLALDTPSYESFLRSSGVLNEALDLLIGVTLADADAVETARRRIQSLVMAAEVQHIVDRLSA
jgi:hypothetical protein